MNEWVMLLAKVNSEKSRVIGYPSQSEFIISI